MIYIDTDWRQRGLCADSKLDFFDLGSPQRQHDLKMLCMNCEAREECLDYAIKTNQESGMWGGMVPDARKKYRRRLYDRAHQQRLREQAEV